MKRTLALIVTAIMLLSLCACGTADKPKDDKDVYSIGIVQLMQHIALDQATEGFQRH